MQASAFMNILCWYWMQAEGFMIFSLFRADWIDDVIPIQSRLISDPSLSDIYFNNEMVWTTLKIFILI